MKLFFHAGALLLSAFVYLVSAVETNYVKTTVVGVGLDDNGNYTDQVSITHTDGLGRCIQSKVNNSALKTSDSGVIPSASKFLTTCNFYDNAGRPVKVTLPFNTYSERYLPGEFPVMNDLLIAEYKTYQPILSSTDPIAYSEKKYYDNPLSSVYQAASPGIDNSIKSNGTVMNWSFGVGKESLTINAVAEDKSCTFEFNGGLIQTELNEESKSNLDILYKYLLVNNVTDFYNVSYTLYVIKNASGKYTQV